MIGTLQSLRFIFVMMIFMSHFDYRDIRGFDAGGDCGVAFFFILSGFVCSLGYGQRIREGAFRYGDFICKRLKKLYPLHLLCLLFFLLVSQTTLDMKVMTNALLLQSWVPDPEWYFSCNKVSWFLSSLLFCYVVFPFVYRHLSRYLTLAVLLAYAAICWLIPYDQVNAVLYVFPLVRFVDFYLGMLLCRLYERKPGMDVRSWMEVLLVVLLFVALTVYPFMDAKLRNAPLFWLVLLPLILVFAQESGVVSRLLKSRPMFFLGSLTMPLFLTHQMLIGILLHRLPEMPAMLMLAVCIFVILMISWGVQIIISRLIRL
jgi:peptidoglycan/LPS O-acetylase OafA/YrhL